MIWHIEQPAGLEESKRKSDWTKTDFDDFEGQ
jgi:NTE family protein